MIWKTRTQSFEVFYVNCGGIYKTRTQSCIVYKKLYGVIWKTSANSFISLLQMKYILFVGENAAEYWRYKNVPSNLD